MIAVVAAMLLTTLTWLVFLAPLAIPAVRQNLSFLNVAASFAVTLTLLSIPLVLVANGGWSVRPGVLLTELAVVAVGIGFLIKQRPWRRPLPKVAGFLHPTVALAAMVLLGIVALLPAYAAIGGDGQTFGMATGSNNDIANYTLTANNVDASGYANSNHLTNVDQGAFDRDYAYTGIFALQVGMAAISGLSLWQVSMPVLSVAIVFMALSLASLASTIWPGKPRIAVLAGIFGALIPLSSYVATNYFLGGTVGTGCAVLCLAATAHLAKGDKHRTGAVIALAAGVAAGMYTYPILLAPVVIGLPFWAVIVRLLSKSSMSPPWKSLTAGVVISLASGLLLVLPSLGTVGVLLKQQSDNTAVGWGLPVMSALDVFVRWPTAETPIHSIGLMVIASWCGAALVVVIGLLCAWPRGARSSVRLSVVLLVAVASVVVAFAAVRGPTTYSSWKMLSYLAPIGAAVALPAIAYIRVRAVPVGVYAAVGLVSVAALSPFSTWQTQGPRFNFLTAATVDLAYSKPLAKLESVNIKTDSYFQNMAIAGLIPTDVAVISGVSYWQPEADLGTCTLVPTEAAAGIEHAPLNQEWALIPYPSQCRLKSARKR